jgi:hypothetical protein
LRTASGRSASPTLFAASRNETYEIIIRRWSGADSVWYGIAWTVTGFSLFYPFDEITQLQRLFP